MSSRNLRATLRGSQYRKELVKGWLAVVQYTRARNIDAEKEWKRHPLRGEKTLEGFVQHLYECDPISNYLLAKHGLLAAQTFCPRLKGKLSSAWEAFESWGQERPGRLRLALPLPCLVAMIIMARVNALSSDGESAYLWWACSVLLETGFFALLRPGELLGLSREKVLLPGGVTSLGGKFALCAVENPKNRRQLGKTQFAVVRSEVTTIWLGWLCSGLAPKAKLWPSSQHKFRSMVKTLAGQVGLKSWRVLPSCLRPGGTTFYFTGGIEPNRLLFWGRWSSEKSLRHYIQESISAQLMVQLPENNKTQLLTVLEHGAILLKPLSRPWWKISSRKDTNLADILARVETCAPASHQDNSAWQKLYPLP